MPLALQLGDDMPHVTRRHAASVLLASLDEAEDIKAAERRLAQWLAGELAGFNALDRHIRNLYPETYRYIGTERNKAWVRGLNPS